MISGGCRGSGYRPAALINITERAVGGVRWPHFWPHFDSAEWSISLILSPTLWPSLGYSASSQLR